MCISTVFEDPIRNFCRELLETYFNSVSEEVYGTSHFEDIEKEIWKALHGDPDAMEYLRIDERDVKLLKALSNKLGGWLEATTGERDMAKRSYRFISTPSWEKKVAKCQE